MSDISCKRFAFICMSGLLFMMSGSEEENLLIWVWRVESLFIATQRMISALHSSGDAILSTRKAAELWCRTMRMFFYRTLSREIAAFCYFPLLINYVAHSRRNWARTGDKDAINRNRFRWRVLAICNFGKSLINFTLADQSGEPAGWKISVIARAWTAQHSKVDKLWHNYRARQTNVKGN